MVLLFYIRENGIYTEVSALEAVNPNVKGLKLDQV